MKFLVVSAFVLFLSQTVAQADEHTEIKWLGGLALGYTSLEFDAKLDSSPVFPSAIVSGVALYDDVFFSLSYGDSFGSNVVSEEEDVGDSNRTDLDITFGYNINKSWNVFAGYKDSETSINFRERDSDVHRDEFYRKNGWFAGATYKLQLEQAGSLSFSLGYIDLSTDNRFRDDDDDDEDETAEFDDLTGRQKGDADGWSYGVSWLIPVNETLFFNTTLKVNDYKETIKVGGDSFSADQKLTFFNTGLFVFF